MSTLFEDGLKWVVKELQTPLVIFGLVAQSIFFMRFFVQWIVSERQGRSTIPVSFWWLSLVGGTMTFFYALKKEDLVFMFSQAAATLIYLRNLMLIYRPRRLAPDPAGSPAAPSAPAATRNL